MQTPTGRDSLNLVEFAIGGLTRTKATSIRREDSALDAATGQFVRRTLTITGSSEYGLPCSFDEDVILAMVAISRARDDFDDRVVPFQTIEVLTLLRITDSGRTRQMVADSLRRWRGVTLAYDRAWTVRGEAKQGVWESHTFGLVDAVSIVRKLGRSAERSTITWNDIFLRSLREGYLKELDLDFYAGLSSPLARRAYRYISKYLAIKPRITRPLDTFAYDKLGLARLGDYGQVKRKLAAPLAELAAKGVMAPPIFERVAQGWTITIARPERAAATSPKPPVVAPGVASRLVEQGVASPVAERLVAEHGPERAERQLEALPRRRGVKDKAAFLVRAVEADFPPPIPPAPAAARPTTTPRSDADRQSVRRAAQVDAAWRALPATERSLLEAKAAALVARADFPPGHLGDSLHRSAVSFAARETFGRSLDRPTP